jgi:tRNA(Ile)-lysidine synthase
MAFCRRIWINQGMPRNPHHSPDYQAVERAFAAGCAHLPPAAATPQRLLLSCSAGGDSMALLDLCVRAATDHRWRLAVIHIDHAQRPESAAEAEFVRQQAGARGCDVFVERLACKNDKPSEDDLRVARHAVWRRIFADWQADALLLAHQADDVAETMLMRLLDGSGPTGLASIQPVQMLAGLRLVRPLLGARRAALRSYLRERELAWHDDPSNADPAFERNWMRHVVLPLLTERIGYDPTTNLLRSAELIAAERESLTAAAALLLQLVQAPPPAAATEAFGAALGAIDLKHPAWPPGRCLRQQLLRHWLWSAGHCAYPPGAEAVQQALAFIEARKSTRMRTAGGRWLVRRGNLLLLFPAMPPEIESADA